MSVGLQKKRVLSSAESESIASQPNIRLLYYLYTQKLCNIYDKPLLSIEITQLIINWLCKKKYLIGSAALSQFWLLNLTQLIMMVFLFFEMRNGRLINGQQMAIIIEEICVYKFFENSCDLLRNLFSEGKNSLSLHALLSW